MISMGASEKDSLNSDKSEIVKKLEDAEEDNKKLRYTIKIIKRP